MKTENTLENKAKFFAQYWGQDVLCRVIFGKNKNEIIMHNTPCSNLKLGEIIDSYLELKPLSQISDDDDLKNIGFTFKNGTSGLNLNIKPNNYDYHWSARMGLEYKEGYFLLEHFDYLRSKGYALPYMDLSVEDLVEYGWVKLKEN